jgi:hypothetical protein
MAPQGVRGRAGHGESLARQTAISSQSLTAREEAQIPRNRIRSVHAGLSGGDTAGSGRALIKQLIAGTTSLIPNFPSTRVGSPAFEAGWVDRMSNGLEAGEGNPPRQFDGVVRNRVRPIQHNTQ